jgi:hypothetical protein
MIAMLENISDISSVVPNIIDMYINEINQGV